MKDFFAAIGLFAFMLGIADCSPAARSKDIHDIDSSIVNVYLDHVM
jgi:hypothetical protein